jgi:thermitase
MDVFGGYCSTHVVIRVAPGVRPAVLDDGRSSLVHQAARDAQREAFAAVESAIANTLQQWQVISILPTADPPPANVSLARQLGLDRYYTIGVPQGTDTPAMVTELSAFGSHIELAELDYIGGLLSTFPNDTYFGDQYGLHNTGQTVEGQAGTPDADIDAPEAWELHTGTDAITLAIIDTGISHSHPDLAAKLLPGRNFSGGDPNDADDGWLISHGTHCAGIAAAISNNSRGVAGVSWGARLMPVKVLDLLGSGTETQCVDGVIWAADHGAHVGSMSLGSEDGTSYFENAIDYAHGQGMVLVAATGNTPGHAIFFPAWWANTIAVGATDNRDQLASFTTYGPEMSVAAPGVSIYSCWDSLFAPDTYEYQEGTSMACPHVAGLACLVWSADLSLTNDEVRQIIESTADDLGAAGWDQYFGYGRINAYQAVLEAMSHEECPGDLDGDGFRNVTDFTRFAAAFGSQSGEPDYNPDADLSGDGFVNVTDFTQFAGVYGVPCP